jgi:peptidoglycan/LPS O-acetylase OafA/YrhL
MKKPVIMFVVLVILAISVVFEFISKTEKKTDLDYLFIALTALVAGFALFEASRKVISQRRGEPDEDEFSKKVMRKTSSVSFYISLYWWLIIMYLSDKLHYETHIFIGAGILGMAVIFAVCWLVFNYTGMKNE